MLPEHAVLPGIRSSRTAHQRNLDSDGGAPACVDVEIVGDAAKQVSSEVRTAYPQVPWTAATLAEKLLGGGLPTPHNCWALCYA
jgi:hypothetical protein